MQHYGVRWRLACVGPVRAGGAAAAGVGAGGGVWDAGPISRPYSCGRVWPPPPNVFRSVVPGVITPTQPKVPEAKARGSLEGFQWVMLGLERVQRVLDGVPRGPVGPRGPLG